MAGHLVRLEWPGPEAFSSLETLNKVLAQKSRKVETVLTAQARSRRRKVDYRGPRSEPGHGRGPRRYGRDRYQGSEDRSPFESGRGEEPGGIRKWRREGVAWRVSASTAALRSLADTVGVKIDRDVSFGLPPPRSTGDRAPLVDFFGRLGISPSLRQRASGGGVRVAIIDSGLDREHPEFRNTHIDLEGSYDWYQPDKPTAGCVAPIRPRDGRPVETRHFHGTAVAGLIAGGSTGLAPAATLIIHNVFYRRDSESQGTRLHAIELSLLYALAAGTDILVMALGTEGFNPCFEDEIRSIREHHRKLFVVAAGNSGPGTHWSPGDYRDVLTVGAVDWEGQVWKGTSGARLHRGGNDYVKPDLYAPGVDIRLPVPQRVDASGYLRRSGTSFATPIVAAVAAQVLGWYRQHDKSITPAEIREHLLATADDIEVPAELGNAGKLLNPSRALGRAGVAR